MRDNSGGPTPTGLAFPQQSHPRSLPQPALQEAEHLGPLPIDLLKRRAGTLTLQAIQHPHSQPWEIRAEPFVDPEYSKESSWLEPGETPMLPRQLPHRHNLRRGS